MQTKFQVILFQQCFVSSILWPQGYFSNICVMFVCFSYLPWFETFYSVLDKISEFKDVSKSLALIYLDLILYYLD